MREWLALRGIVQMFATFALVMLALWGLIALGRYELIVPSPEETAGQFVLALKAHRYEAARHQLASSLQAAKGEGELRALALALERTRGGIEDAKGCSAEAAGLAATAIVRVKLADGTERDVQFPLRQEHALWKIVSFEALKGL